MKPLMFVILLSVLALAQQPHNPTEDILLGKTKGPTPAQSSHSAARKWERVAMLWEQKALDCEGILAPESDDPMVWRRFNSKNTWQSLIWRRDQALRVLHYKDTDVTPPDDGVDILLGRKQYRAIAQSSAPVVPFTAEDCSRENLLAAVQKAAKQLPDETIFTSLTISSGTLITYPPPDKYAGKTYAERLKAIAADKEAEAKEARRAADAEASKVADINLIKRLARECGK